MQGRIDAGVVRIAADVTDQRVVAGTVFSDRPRGLAAALARHPPAAIPDLAQRLFALCGMSHSVAATRALSMAGAPIAVPSLETTTRLLAAERIGAHLQATFMGWNATVPTTAPETAALSHALALTRALDIEGDALVGALATLGISARPSTGSWADRLLAEAGNDGSGQGAPDALTAADDAQVLAALDRHEEAFAAAPRLAGRRPETGAAARAARRGRPANSAAERLGARLGEIAEAAQAIAGTGRPDPAEWIFAGSLGPGIGFCAVETPRGRLHHLARLGAGGAVERYLILAPTEWNFAADGPFAAALQNLRIESGAAKPAIERLASLYDPCVGCAIEVRELHEAARPDDKTGVRPDAVRHA